MLINLNPMMEDAVKNNYAVAAMNAPNLESAMAIIEAAEELQCPVILNHAGVHEDFIPFDVASTMMLDFARNASVPVCVNLDHGTSFEACMRALRAGFTSVMFDGSALSYEENVEQTAEIVRVAHAMGATVEGELGHIFSSETGHKSESVKESADDYDNLEDIYTQPAAAKDFVERTNVDVLAIAFGTAHGLYEKKPVLDLDRIRLIREAIDVPFVMHGGSGLNKEEYQTAIQNGVRKINYFTYMSIAGADAIAKQVRAANSGEILYFHELSVTAKNAMRENAKNAMRIFSMK